MRKSILLFLLIPMIFLSACGVKNNHQAFVELHESYIARGEGVTGYEVSEIESYDAMEFFRVCVCLNTEDAQSIDDMVWFEANVTYFESAEEAQAAYEQNIKTGIGGTCLKEGNILIYWLTGDPFEDLYKEVFYGVFG